MMRTLLRSLCVVAVAVSLVAVSGCGSKTPAGKTPGKTPAAHEHHEGDGHDHSKDKTPK